MRTDRDAMQKAWINYPGRVTNDNIHKDFQAGWSAGREEERAQACGEIVRLTDLAQGRLELLQHSEQSRAYHFKRAEDALAALRIELLDEETEIERLCGRMSADKIATYVDSSPRIQRLRAAIKASELPPDQEAPEEE